MDIVLRIDSIEVENSELVETDWVISDKEDFSNIILSSLADKVNLTHKVFNTELLIYKKRYYARTRLLLKNGYTEWSNTFSFIAEDTNIVVINMSLPTKLNPPIIKTIYDSSAHPLTNFVVELEFLKSILDTKHTSTTWLIEDIDGKTVFIYVNNIINRRKILIKDVKLRPNSIYRILASVKSDSNDASPYGYLTIRTEG